MTLTGSYGKGQDSVPEVTLDSTQGKEAQSSDGNSPFLFSSSTLMNITASESLTYRKKGNLSGLHTGNEMQETHYENTAFH